jgi:hypothetical protein
MSKSWELTMNKGIGPEIRKAGIRGLAIAGEYLRGEALKLVPIEEHILEESGTVTTDPDNLKAAVVFDTPYAVYQHEVMDLQHDEGRSAKFLEIPFNAEKAAMNEIIARTIKGEF